MKRRNEETVIGQEFVSAEQDFTDEYGFPLTFPETVLANMRQALKIPLEVFRSLHDYFDAANNLYARIPLRELYRIYNSQNPAVSEDDFLDAAEIIAHEGNYYVIVPQSVFYDDLSEADMMDRELVAEHLYALDDDEYFKVVKEQEGKHWYVPSRDEFLKYTDPFYSEETPQLLALSNFLRNTQRKLNCPPRDIAEELEDLFRMDYPLQEIIEDAQRLGVRFNNQTDFRLFVKLCLNLSYHSRRHIYCGHTPAELGLPQENFGEVMNAVSYDENYRDPLENLAEVLRANFAENKTVTGKPAKNAPCPCGSGRKYKNCCGKGK